MDNFDDVQKKAQDLTSGITDNSPAQPIPQPKVQEEPESSSFSYAGYGEKDKTKTKTAGGVNVVSGNQPFAVPYTGGGSYPGATLYAAEQNPDNKIVTLKSKYEPVDPYTVQIGNMTGKVDTLNMRKAAYELAALFTPRGIDERRWYGYDLEMEPAEENFIEGLGRGIVNILPTIGITASAELASIPYSIYNVYGELTNNENAIKFSNDMLEAIKDQAEDWISHTTWNYGEMGDNSGQNKSGNVIGSLIPTMLLSLTTGMGGAATFASIEALSNAYEARQAAAARGISGLGGLGIAFGAGAATAALGIAPRLFEKPLKGLVAPAAGWARAIKEAPKEFAKRAFLKNFIVGSIDSLGEAGQDIVTAGLGKGKLDEDDWSYAWRTVLFGTVIGGFAAAINTKANKKSQEYYNNLITDVYKQYKPFFDKAVSDPKSGITQEVVDTWFDFLKNGNTKDGFVEYLYNKMAENLDKYDSMPEEFKQRLDWFAKRGDKNTTAPLADQTAVLDANIDNMLDHVEGLNDASKDMYRQFIRGIALQEYMYNGVPLTDFTLPNVVADVQPGQNPYYNKETQVIHDNTASKYDYVPLSEKQANVDTYTGNMNVSAQVKNQAIDIARRSPNATFDSSNRARVTGHELTHWMEYKTGLSKVDDFMRRMTAWTEQVLPGITSGKGKGTLEMSEAYAYAVQYAKSLKPLLGLTGDMRKYIDLFNAVSVANKASSQFREYNQALAAEMKKNAETMDDLLSSYGENDLRDIIKEYAKTGDPGLLSQEDLKRLFEVMESVVDGDTVSKMQKAFGDRATSQTFIDRYEAEYDKSQQAQDKSVVDMKKVIQEKQQQHTKSIANTATELQKQIVDIAKQTPEAQAKTDSGVESNIKETPAEAKTEVEEKPTVEETKTEQQVEPKTEETQETPPYMQYTGERQPLARPVEQANWIERWLAGEKIPVDTYNKLMERYTQDAKRAIGILPPAGAKYIVRQNMADNKPTGVMTAVWNPSAEDIKAMGLPEAAVRMMDSDQLAAVGRWLAAQDVDAVYSVADDIVDITGGGNDNPFFDLFEKKATITDPAALEFINEAEDIVNSLQDFSASLTHPGTTLNQSDAAYERPLIERAIDLAVFDVDTIEDETARQMVQNAIRKIKINNLTERYVYLNKQAEGGYTVGDNLNLPRLSKKDTSDPWGVWNKYGAKKRPLTTVLNYSLNDPKSYDVSYWINRMGLDVDKYPSVEALESMVISSGLEPVDFSRVAVTIDKKNIPLFSDRETQAAEFGAIYGHKGVNQPINLDFNIKALKHILNGRATKDKLIEYMLNQVRGQLDPDTLHLSLGEKFREIAALGRAKMIADQVFAERADAMSRFSEWATVTAKGGIGVGADITGLGKETKQQNFEKMQQEFVSSGKMPYMSRTDLNTNRLPVGLEIAFLYSGSWKQGVITANNMYTDQGNPFYVIRVLNDGDKGTYDLVWDAREFELLQNSPMGNYKSSLFAKMDLMPREEFSKIASEDYWTANYKGDADDAIKYNFTSIAADAKLRKKNISKLLSLGDGEVVADDISNLYSVSSSELKQIKEMNESAVSRPTMSDEEFRHLLGGDEFLNTDPFADLSNEEFENVDVPQRDITITGKEKTNQEVYEKMKLAEEARRQPVTAYLNSNVPGFGKDVSGTLDELIAAVEDRKIRPMLFGLTGGSGIQSRSELIFGDKIARKLGLNMMADRAERVAEDFKKELEKAFLEKTFKNQKELGEWQVRVGIDLDGVQAELSDRNRPISKEEIMTLYLADLSKDGKNVEFRIPYMYGGTIEENGYTYIYNMLHSEYKNFDDLIGHLTEQDKDAAKILFRYLPILRGVDMNDQTSWFGKFIPVNTYKDYATDGWDNRRGHNAPVFGTRLLKPNSRLVATGLLNSSVNMAGGAGLRSFNYKRSVQFLSDMLNLSALADDGIRYSRGFRMDLAKGEEPILNSIIEKSGKLKDLISDKIGANNFKSYMNDISDILNKNDPTDGKTWIGDFFRKLTRTSSAMALSLKPRQIFTNLIGNYMVLGGLSSHSPLWYNTIGLANAILHGKQAWTEATKKNGTFRHRWEQAALSKEYQRAADTKGPSIIQDAEKAAFEQGMEGAGKALAVADDLAKKMTKYSIGLTNTAPDMTGISLGRWAVLDDVKASIAAEAQANNVKLSEEEIARLADERIADYMFSHISSSNIMTRGRWSKSMARMGLEGLVAFKNDMLQKSASLANAWTRLNNTQDPTVRNKAWHEIEGIILSDVAYVSIQAGLIHALIKSLTGEDLSDKEKEYLYYSLFRESLAQIADAFNGGTITQSILESVFLGVENGITALPISDVFKLARNVRKGNYWTSGAILAGLAGFSPMERALQMTRALSMVYGDDERAAQVGWMMLAGRGESTAKNMLGYTTNKKGKIVPKKSNKKKE